MEQGTILNMEETSGAWFEMDGGGRVQLRTLTYNALKQITKQSTRKQVTFKKVEGTPGRFEYEDVDEDLKNELFWDHCIVAWENLFDSKEKAIPCNKENKILLMTRSSQFLKFITSSLEVLSKDEEDHTQAAEKNLSTP